MEVLPVSEALGVQRAGPHREARQDLSWMWQEDQGNDLEEARATR